MTNRATRAAPMTDRERLRRADKYRLMAGKLYVDLYGKSLGLAEQSVKAAHDAMLRAVNILEDRY